MIIITTYHEKINDNRFFNRREYLKETIDSIDKQTAGNIIHIVVDDGSDMSVYEYLYSRYNNPGKRIVLRREKGLNEPLTSTNARNFAIDFCLQNLNLEDDEYLTFIDSDDLLVNLEKRIECLLIENPDFAYMNSLLFFDKSDIAFEWIGLETNKAYKNFWVYGGMPYPTMTWKISFLKRLKEYTKTNFNISGPFDPNIGCGEDVDIALSSFEVLIRYKLKISFFPFIATAYRIHNHSLATIRSQSRRSKEEMIVIRRHFGNFFTPILYIKRFLIRPECTIHSIMKIKNLFRKKIRKNDFL